MNSIFTFSIRQVLLLSSRPGVPNLILRLTPYKKKFASIDPLRIVRFTSVLLVYINILAYDTTSDRCRFQVSTSDVLPICQALLETGFLAVVRDTYREMLLPLQPENSELKRYWKEQWNATMAGKGLEFLSRSSMSTT